MPDLLARILLQYHRDALLTLDGDSPVSEDGKKLCRSNLKNAMPPPIISVNNLGKKYLVGHQSAAREKYTALRDVLARNTREFFRKTNDILKGRQIVYGDEIEEFWALKKVSFEVQEGEVIGIIGRNGAGKSTLLKILSRITDPTEGRIRIRGRVASLLEVGTGFHPELTGRENIFLNGAILGMKRQEIKAKFDEIVDFAGVEKFLDTPVKRYSSGMYVRLAFAVAAHLEPEILIVDEVLAVGDTEFQKKCLGKMQSVSSQGRTVLFVSHNLSSLKNLCKTGILLNQGSVQFIGNIDLTLNEYAKNQISTDTLQINTSNFVKKIKIKNNDSDCLDGIVDPSKPVQITFRLENCLKHTDRPRIGIGINAGDGSRVTTIATFFSKSTIILKNNMEIIRCLMPVLPLSPGKFSLKISIGNEAGDFEVIPNALEFTISQSDFHGNGRIQSSGQGLIQTISEWSKIDAQYE